MTPCNHPQPRLDPHAEDLPRLFPLSYNASTLGTLPTPPEASQYAQNYAGKRFIQRFILAVGRACSRRRSRPLYCRCQGVVLPLHGRQEQRAITSIALVTMP